MRTDLKAPDPDMAQSNLTPKQKRFCEEYLLDLNATAAYRRAGYKPTTEATAWNNASRLLGHPGVKAQVEGLMAQRAERVEVTLDEVIRRLMIEADYHGKDSSHSARVRAIELLGKHVGAFTDRVDHGGRVILDFSLQPK